VVVSVPVRSRRVLALAIGWLLLLGAGARGEPVEVPADVADGEDVTYEENDSLVTGEVELGVGVAGTASRKPQHRRRVRFDEPDFSGSLREGQGDPLSGGEVVGRSASDRFVLGKLSPRWGRGLLLGSPGDPWQRATQTLRGGRRGRAGEGLLLSRGESRRMRVSAIYETGYKEVDQLYVYVHMSEARSLLRQRRPQDAFTPINRVLMPQLVVHPYSCLPSRF